MIKGVSLVVVHPIVLLSVVDHYNRIQSDRRVVGVLLGTNENGRVEVTSSYAGFFSFFVRCLWRQFECAGWGVFWRLLGFGLVWLVPFEEDRTNPRIWFLDHNYHEKMWAMSKKVNANEKV